MLVVWEIVTTRKRKMILKHFGEYSVPITWDMLTQHPEKVLLFTPNY